MGSGGKEAEDWSFMVESMLLSFVEKMGFHYELLDKSLKVTSYEIKGKYAYAWLRSEEGIHRLSRVSLYGSGNKRQTSFCAVKIIPKFKEITIKLEDKDLDIKCFKSSGPGGQHVNTTDSAVRIKHKPSGISVTCRKGRSQHQNKKTAMAMLQIRVEDYLKKKNIVNNKEYLEASFGNHIRTYVMNPYELVNDHRTGVKLKNLKALDGEIYEFSKAYLKSLKE